MSEFREGQIPVEYTRERPPVFDSEKGWKLVRDFALRYGELKEGASVEDIASSIDLIRRVEQSTASRIHDALPALLEQNGFSQEEQTAFLEAAENRSFANVDFKDKEQVVAALGLAMVAERARNQTMVNTLERMDKEGLRALGMTPDQRNVVTGLLETFSAANPEYIRFKARSMTGEEYSERPVDAIREESRIAKGMRKVREELAAKGPENVFGEAGPEFCEYLELYEKGYQPLSQKEGKPLSKDWKEERASRFRKAFETFIREHPDFPLILFPRGDEYVSDASGLKLGRDPEIRVSWQSPELKKEAQGLTRIRDRFIEHLDQRFGPLLEEGDLERIRTNRPLIANDLGYFGIGMQVRFEAQELEGTSVIFENVQLENRESTRKTLLRVFGDDARDIIDSPAFIEMANAEMMVHEWGHQVHNPDTGGAKALGEKTESGINEMKSDVLSYAALHDVLGERARELYGERAEEALNMYMLGYALDGAKTYSPDSEERPYYMGAVAMLNRLAESGVIIENENGVTIDQEKMRVNLSEEVFQPQAQEILALYHDAEHASAEELKRIREKANVMGEQIPDPLVKKLIGELKTEETVSG